MEGFWPRVAYFTLAVAIAAVITDALRFSLLGTVATVTVVVLVQDLTIQTVRRHIRRRRERL